MKTTSIPTEQIEALVQGLQLHNCGAVSGTIEDGKLNLSVIDAEELGQLKSSLDEALAEDPKPLNRGFMDDLKARAATVKSIS